MTHPQDCIASMMEPRDNIGVIPTPEDFLVAKAWQWTRANGERIELGAMTPKDLKVLHAFVDKQLRRLAFSVISYTHLCETDKAQTAADQLAFLREAETMITLEKQRRFALYLKDPNR